MLRLDRRLRRHPRDNLNEDKIAATMKKPGGTMRESILLVLLKFRFNKKFLKIVHDLYRTREMYT